MELLDAPAVVNWLRELKLDAVARAAEDNDVDGNVLVALARDYDGLTELGVTSKLQIAKIKGGIAKLAQSAERAQANVGERPSKRARRSGPASPLTEPAAADAAPAVPAAGGRVPNWGRRRCSKHQVFGTTHDGALRRPGRR